MERKDLERIIENLEYELGCWNQEYTLNPSEENYNGKVDTEKSLRLAMKGLKDFDNNKRSR